MPLPSTCQRLVALNLSLTFAACQAAIPPEQLEFFESRIRPIFAQDCYECHSTAGKKKGGLLLDSRAGWQKGGDSGAVVVPGQPKESLLLKSIRHEDPDLKMPDKGAKLEPAIIADFERWIAMGAPDPRDHPPSKETLAQDTNWRAVLDRRKGWWSFQPISNPAVPAASNPEWSSHPVDRFLRVSMKAEGLEPTPDADPRVRLRRLSYILTGLPPSPDETARFIAAFERDPKMAWEDSVNRALSSPRFGERWARHMMDWMRYAETHGSEGDPHIPYAWRYRDYLIRALNADVALPQIIREHIAGDLLENPRIDGDAGINESAIGGAHYRMVLHGYTPTDALDEQATFTDNQIDTLTKAFLGLTVSCARCHDHKFDAISQTDFYALYGVMASCRPATIDVNLPERQTLHVEQMKGVKRDLRDRIADMWIERLGDTGARLHDWKPKDDKEKAALINADAGALAAWLKLAELPAEKWPEEWQRQQKSVRQLEDKMAEFRRQPALIRWDLAAHDSQIWLRDGAGVREGASPAGEFHISTESDRVIEGLFPRGVYSHLFSDKHRGVLQSPPLAGEGGKMWLRIRGGGGARARYVVRNYPRTGTVYAKTDLASAADQWISWPLEYWKGDTLHLEITTEADQPVETRNTERSWFGIAEVLYAKNERGPAPPPIGVSFHRLNQEEDRAAPTTLDELSSRYLKTLRQCIERWKADRISDEESEFLAEFVRLGLLPNRPEDLGSSSQLVAEYRRLEKDVPTPTRAPGVLEGFASDQPLFVRGDHKKPAEPVPRRFLEAINAEPFILTPGHSGRRELADAVLSPGNPLTDRVLANRIWHHVFGRGIVATPDNFGRLGETPTHPDLLDYLATELRQNGGSVKCLIRHLVTSRSFQLGSEASPVTAERDPENLFLSHFPARRLDAESIRDSMLMLTARIDFTDGPPGDGGSYRRSVYTSVIRNRLDPLLSAFDFPVPSATRGRRDSTNVPAQALALLNDPSVEKWAGNWSARILSNKEYNDDTARARRMFEEAFGRPAADLEVSQGLAYVRLLSAEGVDAADVWRSFAQSLFNTKEFLYLR